LLCLFTFGDVGMSTQHTKWLTLRVMLNHLAKRENPFPTAVPGPLTKFHPVFWQQSTGVIYVGFGNPFPVVWVQAFDPGRVGFDKRLKIIPEHLRVLPVYNRITGLDIEIIKPLICGL